MAEFLLELLSEEIPARMQDRAAADLARLFAGEAKKAGLGAPAIETFAGPRRLAILARGLPDATAAVSEETKGPRADAPEQAIAGFLKKAGVARGDLVERADAKGNAVLFAVREVPGRATAHVLAEIVPAAVRHLAWPKSMRWGEASASMEAPRWVRPLQGVVALLDEAVVPCAVAGIASGRETAGHRFMATGAVTIARAGDYADTLRAAHVIVDVEERRGRVRDGARAAAAAAGLAIIEDEGLVAENAGLTEWPVPMLGRFDPTYLEVPREVIQLTMRTNQKYFACSDAGGALAPAFVCTANIEGADGGAAIVAGNAKVLAARLADARFFWEQDLRVPLAEQAAKLGQIVFHEKLGTVADKVARVAKLAEWLATEGIVLGCDPALARRAAELCKADLVTGMVGEFPELQGVMGGYYARAQGLPDQVADAIRDHYKPVGQGDEVPTAPVTVAVSLADKLDTLGAFFVAGMPPSGSKDPFALRRAALAVILLIMRNGLRFKLRTPQAMSMALAAGRVAGVEWALRLDELLTARESAGEVIDEEVFESEKARLSERAVSQDAKALFEREAGAANVKLLEFVADRLKVQQREAGVRHDLIDAVFTLGGEDDLVRLLARVKALQGFVETDEGADLLAGYRRAANILRKEGVDPASFRHPGPVPGSTDPRAPARGAGWTPEQVRGDGAGRAYEPEPAERALAEAIEAQLPLVAAAIDAEAFGDAMGALAALRAPIDAFFEGVVVNDPDPERRTARLALLARLVAAMHNVADFSRIEG